MPVNQGLINYLKANFRLDWQGIHGVRHWARVRRNGLIIAADNGADKDVIQLFAFIHDAERYDDYTDPGHGERAAVLAEHLNGQFFDLSRKRLGWLMQACEMHSDGHARSASGLAAATITACWDADRLDLGRIGIRPEPKYLSNAVAKSPTVIDVAYARSRLNISQ